MVRPMSRPGGRTTGPVGAAAGAAASAAPRAVHAAAARHGPLRTANLIFLSPVDPAVVDGVNSVLGRLGEPPAGVRSLVEPLNLLGIATASAGTRYGKLSERKLGLIRALGRDRRDRVRRSPPRSSTGSAPCF